MQLWRWLGVAAVGAALPLARLDAAELLHETVAGDTLWALCRDYSKRADCASALQQRNGIGDARRIPVGTVIRIPAGWLREARIVGGVLEKTGTAHYKALSVGQATPLVVDEPVYLGDEIRTADGTAVLEFVSGLMVLLRPDSLVLLDSVSDDADAPVVNLTLDHGGMEVATPEPAAGKAPAKPAAVSTAAAIAGIAGSARLDVGADGSSMRGETLRGTVKLSAAGATAEVPEGYAAVIDKSGASTPRALLPAPAFVAGAAPPHSVQWRSAGAQMAALVNAMQAWLARSPQAMPAPDAALGAELAQQLRGVPAAESVPDSIGSSFQPAHLEWEGASPAQDWQLDVATAPRGRSVLASFRTTESGIDLPSIAPGCYVIGLRAIDAEGFQGRETRRTLCLHPQLAAAQAPSLVSSTDLVHRFAWPAIEHAAGYVVELAEDERFERILLARQSVEPAIDLPRSGGRIEFVRVRAFNAAGLEGPSGAAVRLGETSRVPVIVLGILTLTVLLL